MIYANRLKKSDLIGICAPASPIHKPQLLKGVHFLEEIGFQTVLGKHIYESSNYLAGTDEQRAADLNSFLRNEQVKGIIFARGGYGMGRIASKLDYETMKKDPKVILGYSDMTYLHLAIYKKTGLITFHGPMVMTLGHSNCDSFTKNELQYLLSPSIKTYDETVSKLTVLVEGEGKGAIVGGNLSIIMSTIGTQFEINFNNKILFIEDIGEQLYKIDRLLNQLTQTNKLHQLNGIVIGDFNLPVKKETVNKPSSQQTNQTKKNNELNELFYQYFKNLNIPVMSGFKIGHCFPHFIIPHGAPAKLSTKQKQLTIYPALK